MLPYTSKNNKLTLIPSHNGGDEDQPSENPTPRRIEEVPLQDDRPVQYPEEGKPGPKK